MTKRGTRTHRSSCGTCRALEPSEALARHSVVYLDSTELGPRSRILETVREFVAEQLALRPDAAEIGRTPTTTGRWPSRRIGRAGLGGGGDCR
jgi:hypothetical protein